MSAILIKWKLYGLNSTYEHIALLLNGMGPNVYISIYRAKAGCRFTSRTLLEDRLHAGNESPSHSIIPTLEDGNPLGLSESVIAMLWSRLYFLKKLPHEDLLENEKKISAEKMGEFNALVHLSQQLKFFDSKYLDCTQFIFKLLLKGGLSMYLPNVSQQSGEKMPIFHPAEVFKVATFVTQQISLIQFSKNIPLKIKNLSFEKLTKEQENIRIGNGADASVSASMLRR